MRIRISKMAIPAAMLLLLPMTIVLLGGRLLTPLIGDTNGPDRRVAPLPLYTT